MQNGVTQPEYKFHSLDLKRVGAEGEFEGYASLFNRQDMGRDVIAPGAFSTSLKKRGPQGVKMLFQHDPHQPIGVWQALHEDARGLYVKGRLMIDVARAREVLSLMRAGALDGLSIGFKAKRGWRDRKTGLRRLQEVDLWEISIVTFPMLPEARVSSVKARPFFDKLPTRREFERWLTRDAGLTRSEAHAVMRGGLKGLETQRDASRANRTGARLKSRMDDAARLMRSN